MISGASGLLGTALTRTLRSEGHETIALVRRSPRENEVQWNPRQPLDPAKLAGCDAVVHLAGKNIAGLWTAKFKKEVMESRSLSTQVLATAAAESFRRTGQPRVFVSASGVGYYGNRGDEVLTEQSVAGAGFLAYVCQQWEAAAAPARDAGLRVVNLRIGLVLTRHGGALKPLLLQFRLGWGGRIGSGKQWWSWIALDDVIGAMKFAVQNDSLQGAVNVVAPGAVQSGDFVRALGKAMKRPTFLPLPEFVIRTVMGEMGDELLLTSAHAVPEKLLGAGYRFQFTNVEEALRAALK